MWRLPRWALWGLCLLYSCAGLAFRDPWKSADIIALGWMQAIAEGLEIMRHSPLDLKLDTVTSVWQKGSIVSGLLMDMTAAALAREPDLHSIEGVVAASGEANWTINEAVRLGVAAPTIAAALFARFKSQDTEKFAEKSVAAMRREFGGHAVVYREEE